MSTYSAKTTWLVIILLLVLAIGSCGGNDDAAASEFLTTVGGTGESGEGGEGGEDGKDGKDGKDGSPGINGKDGKDGAPGPAPTREEILSLINEALSVKAPQSIRIFEPATPKKEFLFGTFKEWVSVLSLPLSLEHDSRVLVVATGQADVERCRTDVNCFAIFQIGIGTEIKKPTLPQEYTFTYPLTAFPVALALSDTFDLLAGEHTIYFLGFKDTGNAFNDPLKLTNLRLSVVIQSSVSGEQ